MRNAILAIILGVSLLFVVVTGFLFARTFFYVTDSFRYRITLNFVVDGVPLSATGVVKETIHQPPCFLVEQHCGRTAIEGDAFPVRFPNGKTIFVLLGVLDGLRAVGAFPSADIPNPPSGHGMNERLGQVFSVRSRILPTLVYFGDINDPYSVKVISPKDLTLIAGPTASYQGATVSVTNDAVTRGIRLSLPWVATFKSDLKLERVNLDRYVLMQNLPLFLERNDW